MPRREYSGNAKPTTLNGGITAAATSIAVADGTGYPTGATGPFVVTIAAGTAAEEKVLVASRSGTTLTVSARGWDGTTASAHDNSVSVAHTFSATDADEMNAFVNGGAAGTFVAKAGGDTITASAATVIPLVVKGAASQTADLFRATDSANAVKARIDTFGNLVTGSASAVGMLNALADNPAAIPLAVRGAAAQTSNLIEARDSADAIVLRVSASGSVTTTANMVAGGHTPIGRATVYNGTAATVGLVVRGAASQTANLAEFQNSAGTVVASVSAGGAVFASQGGITRELVFGDPDTAGTGFRNVRVAN